MPLLRVPISSSRKPARVIWTSSLEAVADAFDIKDMQAIESPVSYESSKRLTDILALGSFVEGSKADVTSFLTPEPSLMSAEQVASTRPPKMILTHPGLVKTAIVNLNIIFAWFW